MVQRRQSLRFALETGEVVGVVGESGGQDFDGHVSIQLGIAGPIDLAHPARAEGRKNFVGSEMVAGGEAHVAGFYPNSGCYNPGMSPPVAPVPVQQGHARIDARSLAMHRAIAAKLLAEPGLLAIAHDNLRRWAGTAGRSQPYLDAWGELLAKPISELAVRIQEDSEVMRAIRQTSPFAGVLSPRERWEIYDAFAVGASDSGRGPSRMTMTSSSLGVRLARRAGSERDSRRRWRARRVRP